VRITGARAACRVVGGSKGSYGRQSSDLSVDARLGGLSGLLEADLALDDVSAEDAGRLGGGDAAGHAGGLVGWKSTEERAGERKRERFVWASPRSLEWQDSALAASLLCSRQPWLSIAAFSRGWFPQSSRLRHFPSRRSHRTRHTRMEGLSVAQVAIERSPGGEFNAPASATVAQRADRQVSIRNASPGESTGEDFTVGDVVV
jgi:hypothetical protein